MTAHAPLTGARRAGPRAVAAGPHRHGLPSSTMAACTAPRPVCTRRLVTESALDMKFEADVDEGASGKESGGGTQQRIAFAPARQGSQVRAPAHVPLRPGGCRAGQGLQRRAPLIAVVALARPAQAAVVETSALGRHAYFRARKLARTGECF